MFLPSLWLSFWYCFPPQKIKTCPLGELKVKIPPKCKYECFCLSSCVIPVTHWRHVQDTPCPGMENAWLAPSYQDWTLLTFLTHFHWLTKEKTCIKYTRSNVLNHHTTAMTVGDIYWRQPFGSLVKQKEADIQLQEWTCFSTQMEGLLERKSSDMARA